MGIIDVFVKNSGILTKTPAFAGQTAFMQVLWQHCLSDVIDCGEASHRRVRYQRSLHRLVLTANYIIKELCFDYETYSSNVYLVCINTCT